LIMAAYSFDIRAIILLLFGFVILSASIAFVEDFGKED